MRPHILGKSLLSTLDKQGRITIPKPIRDHLGLKPGDKVDFVIENGRLTLRRVEPSRAA